MSKDEITEALKHKVWTSERRIEGAQVVENGPENAENQEALKKTKIHQRLVLKRFDIFFTLDNLYRIVFEKV